MQLELLRAATPARRFALARSLTQTTIELSREAIRRQRPHLTDLEVKLEWVALSYGEDLAFRVRKYLEQLPG